MVSWLAYSLAFAPTVAALVVAHLLGFVLVFSMPFLSYMLLFLFLVLLPLCAALAVFVLFCRFALKKRFQRQHLQIAAGAALVAGFVWFGIVVGNAMEELPSALLLGATLFVAGHPMFKRADHV